MLQRKQIEEDIKLYIAFQGSPIVFIKSNWGLVPQPVKKEYREQVKGYIRSGQLNKIKHKHFAKFIKGEHLTWQQWLILLAVERAIQGKGLKRISVVSGHGTGKSATLAWLILWYLFCFKDAQIPCTAPSREQMHDVLWKEVALWHGRLPEQVKELYEIQGNYIRIKERPKTWFARARTARKENPEALAGVHGEWVMFIIDEASGVASQVFDTAEGSLTGDNVLVIMISNGVRLTGYFFDSHHTDQLDWQNFSLDSNKSPIVDEKFVARIIRKHGKDSDEYKIRVSGKFPESDAVDDQGYVPILLESDLRFTENDNLVKSRKMGVDPAGEGSNETVWVVRDRFKAKVVAREKISSPAGIAKKTIALMDLFEIRAEDVFVDNFGPGANVAKEILLATPNDPLNVIAINVGDPADELELYLNKRAEVYTRLQLCIRAGAELVNNKKWLDLLSIRSRRGAKDRIQILSKKEMRKVGIRSPDVPDALSLTFTRPDVIEDNKDEDFDLYGGQDYN